MGPGREFDRIRAIAAALGPAARQLGDDCAVIPEGEGRLVASTDVSVEGVHFLREWIALDEFGWRAAAASLSDLAASGTEPVGLLAAVVVPPAASDEDVVLVMRGVGDAARAAGTAVLGGDLSSGPCWSATITVFGWSRRPLGRAGARPGDAVWVTGRLGAARAAVEAWQRGEAPAPGARAAFAHPEPRIQAGRWLADHGATALLDLSDGLGGDVQHLAAASEVAVQLTLDRLPVAPEVAPEASRMDVPAQQFAVEGGEDYELLVALPETFAEADRVSFEGACGLGLTRIGSIARGRGVRCTLAGRPISLSGFQHFALAPAPK